MGLLVLELPDVEEGFALGSPAILWEEHVSYFTQSLAEYMLERFGFRIFDRRRYVFGGGSLAFVAQKQAVPSACTVARPPSAPTIDLLNGFVAGMERHKSEMRELVSLARSTRLQRADLWRRAAFLPVGLGLPDRRDDRLRGRRSAGHTSQADAGHAAARPLAEGNRRTGWAASCCACWAWGRRTNSRSGPRSRRR